LLQAWEFLYHFFELIGQESFPTFENLEAWLSDMGLVLPGNGLPNIDDGNCNFLPKFEEDMVQNKVGLSETRDEGQIGVAKLGERLSRNRVKE
jgi:hypothetical protein